MTLFLLDPIDHLQVHQSGESQSRCLACSMEHKSKYLNIQTLMVVIGTVERDHAMNGMKYISL